VNNLIEEEEYEEDEFEPDEECLDRIIEKKEESEE